MNYNNLTNQCKDYIRANLSSDITARELADLCGYSLYHLSSVFRACFGCSIGRFIMEERLRIAARRILEGDRITDIAVDSGFDTSSGFTRAFRKQFACSPRDYRKHASDLTGDKDRHASDPTGDKGRPTNCSFLPVHPEFVKRTELKVYGYVIPVSEEASIEKAAFWSQVDFKAFPAYPDQASDYAEIAVWINPDKETGQMDYFFGYVTSDPSPSAGFEQITLPGGDYVVFRLHYSQLPKNHEKDLLRRNLPASVQALWRSIFEDWFADEVPVLFDDSRLCFEKYGEDHMEIYVPVMAKQPLPPGCRS